jgi:PilZ domain
VPEPLLDAAAASGAPALSPPLSRACARYYYRLPLMALLRRSTQGPAWVSALLRDICAGGAGLVIGHEIPPGTSLLVRLPAADAAGAVTHLARVAHATRHGPGLWLVGCRFASALTEEQLRLLLDAGPTALKPTP